MAAMKVARQGHVVHAFKPRIDERVNTIKQLRQSGGKITDLGRLPLLPQKIFSILHFLSRPLFIGFILIRLWLGLKIARSEFIILSQGGNWDGFYFARLFRRMKIPYAMISQKAAEYYWPPDYLQRTVRENYQASVHNYFVSHHNHILTQEQLGIEIAHSSVVRNPFLVPYEQEFSWPQEDGITHFACIGRLYPMEKGQDILLHILRDEKWQARKWTLTFYGSGVQEQALKNLVTYLGLENITFAGHVDNIEAIWQKCHALILPSRCEGLPLVLVEAMLCGRVAITTDVGGSGEVLVDGKNGFLAKSPSIHAVAATMECAWERRSEWKAIGAAAAIHIRSLVSVDPANDLAEHILSIAQQALSTRV